MGKKVELQNFSKKGYYSKDREGNIIFDISIEMFLPDTDEYSMVVLIECKNYNHPVPVNDVEEFFAKVQQVGAANTKAIIASTNSFQHGTLKFAQSKKIGLLRYFDPTNLKWELHRHSSQSYLNSLDSTESVQEGLISPTFKSKYCALYLQSPSRYTNDLLVFIEDLIDEKTVAQFQIQGVINSKNRISTPIVFIDKSKLEEKSNKILKDIEYHGGEVSLEEICRLEKERSNLNVVIGKQAPSNGFCANALGRILFASSEIQVFGSLNSNRGRERFTLAHELAHHFLQNGKYMLRESCDESDFSNFLSGIEEESDISKLELQANYFASSLLMPKINFTNDFWKFANEIGLVNRGFGALFKDNQPCNIKNYMYVTTKLMQRYGVSRSSADIRLASLGLLFKDTNNSLSDIKHYEWGSLISRIS